MAKKPAKRKVPLPAKGNYISEWLGQRIYPVVRLDVGKFPKTGYETCPFLSTVLRSPPKCVKNENSLGVCTINAASNGPRQDWLACPYRVIDSGIVTDACEKIFSSKPPARPTPASLLSDPAAKRAFQRAVRAAGRGHLFFQDKLGGEISILGSDRSPEMAFDITVVEILNNAGRYSLGRYGILEVQTMDFHGSYKKAVGNLRDAYRLHKKGFADALRIDQAWAAEDIEGPNIANVFKRTFYQMMLKFELGGKGAAAGTVLAIPQAVWDSWQPFLGKPVLARLADGTFEIKSSKSASGMAQPNAHICVFDLDASRANPISPVTVKQFIRVSPDQLAHHAFDVVPKNMLTALQGQDSILSSIKTRLMRWWPDLEIASRQS
ncbi:MAG: hypothetical protein ACREVG_03710 [Burkholderiales bacterium]